MTLTPPSYFYAPWENDQRLYPGKVLEAHMARCRSLELPETSTPAQLTATMGGVCDPKAREDAQRAGNEAVALCEAMFGDYPPGSAPYALTDSPFLPLWDTNARWDHLVLWGGRSGSKSFQAAAWLAEQSSRQKETVLCLRQFQNSIKNSAKKLIQDQIIANNMATFFEFTETEIKNTSTGSTFDFWGIERSAESLKSASGITIAWMEEAQTASAKGIDLVTPTVRDPGSRLIWTGNARYETDAWHDMFFDPAKPRPENSVVRYCGAEHNAHHYRTRSPAEMRTRFKGGDISKFRHIWRGFLDVTADTLVVKDVIAGTPPVALEKLADATPRYGLDFGFSDDPTAAVRLWRFDKDMLVDWDEDGKPVIYIDREFTNLGMTNAQIMSAFDDVMPCLRQYGLNVTADSSEPRTIAEINTLAAGAFALTGAKKGPGSVAAGYRWLNGHTVYVNQTTAPETLKALQNMRYKVDRAGKATTEIDHQFSHIPDAIRYSVEDIALGDGVAWI